MTISTLFSSTFNRWTGRETAPVQGESQFPDLAEAPLDTRRLIRNRRYCQVLAKRSELEFDNVSQQCARSVLEHEMALVPRGTVRLMHDEVFEQDRRYGISQSVEYPVEVDSFFLDRLCVTNADYLKFVQGGGYALPQLWPEETLPWVLLFVDRTGTMGPKFWTDGKPPSDKLDHPVVGICWYEASAYARWAGKRLPTSAEWQRAGTWPKGSGVGSEQRYPWGNSFEQSRANLWKHTACDTIPVDALPKGSTPNGVRQLIGNVWEWVDAQFCPAHEGEVKVLLEEAMAEVRGGAFDTYFASQATCQFRTGYPVLHRSANVGFRCCASLEDLHSPIKIDAEEEIL
ncbi:MAG: SUMF1/EgtB/PvdO family nonheme iron enzyme [Pirellulaceae bacterium]